MAARPNSSDEMPKWVYWLLGSILLIECLVFSLLIFIVSANK